MNKKVALQIRCYEPWKETALAMQKCGFQYVSMVFDESFLSADNWKENVMDIDAFFKQCNLKCVMTHAPYYDLLLSAEKRIDDTEVALYRSIEATKILGAEICAVHPRSCIIDGAPREIAVDRDKSLKENIISFQPLVEACEKFNVLLGIENLMRYPFAHPYFYSWIAEDHAKLIDEFNSKKVCAIWDFGHANLIDVDHAERIHMLGGRIKGTHVHNNDGIQDDHYPPFLPEETSYYVRRSVDWYSVLGALKDTGFDGYLTLETVFPYQYPIEGYVRYLYDSICVLDDILKGKNDSCKKYKFY